MAVTQEDLSSNAVAPSTSEPSSEETTSASDSTSKEIAPRSDGDSSLLLEILCGATVALAQVPEAVAFSLAAGLPPAIGLTSAWIIGLVTSLLGGRPAMICGATGSLAVVVGGVVQNHGVEYLFYAVILMGMIQILLGLVRVGALLKLIPTPVMIGFCNGLALVIGLAQFNNYKIKGSAPSEKRRLEGSFSAFTDGVPFISGLEAVYSVSITAVALLTCLLLPRLTKKVPSALVAIGSCTAIEWFLVRALLNGKTSVVGDIASAGGSFPIPMWFDPQYEAPPLNLTTLQTIAPLALTMAAIGLLESLMTLNLIDEITKTKSSTVRECIGQGFANLLCGSFGGMGGCAMIGQSMININSGARNRVSSASAALLLLAIVLAAYPAINIIPVSALVGVMFNVCICTFEWSSLKLMFIAAMPGRMRKLCLTPAKGNRKIRRFDAFVILLVTIATLLSDLAVAVACGVALSCFIYAYESTLLIDATSRVHEDPESGNRFKVYNIQGVLFFGSSAKFLELFDVENDPDDVRLVFESVYVRDYTAIDALNKLGERYGTLRKKVTLFHLQPACSKIVGKASGLLVKELELAAENGQPLGARRHHYNVEALKPTFDI